MKKLFAFMLVLTSLHVFAQQAPVFQTEEGAIRGYDPVAYFNNHEAVKGSKQFSYSWQGANWYFVSDNNLNAFKADPTKYAPQYGGYCAYGLSEGHKAPTEPDAWTIVDGKLYLNYSQKVRETWRKNQKERIETADKNWPALKDKG